MMLPKRSTKSGFTIIEVVLAMGLLMIGMSVILTLMTFGAGMSRDAELRSESAGTARAIVADLEETLFPLDENGTVGAPVDIVERALAGYPDLLYSARATLNPDRIEDEALATTNQTWAANGALEYRVEVDVTWKSRGEKRSRGFVVLLTRELPFGARLRRLLVDPQVESQ